MTDTATEAQARALWYNAKTPELRAHLRKIYPDLLEHAPDPKPNGALRPHSAAGTRAAWKAVKIHAPDKTEPQCREVIRLWAKNGVLVRDEYYSDADRKKRGGLRVNNAKRPGTETGR
jgi:hypothetical protein